SLFPAIDRQHLAVDKPGQIRGKEHDSISYIRCAAQPFHRDPVKQRSLSFLSIPSPLLFRCGIGANETGRDAVDGDPERTELVSELSSEADHRVFRRAI